MSDESQGTTARARRTPLKLWERLVLWLGGTAIGCGVVVVQTGFLPSPARLLRYGFEVPHQLVPFMLWIASAWFVGPKFVRWIFPALFAWAWLWLTYIFSVAGI